MPFKLNDYVRVKPGTLLEDTGELSPEWVGQIAELPVSREDQTYMVELDAPSLSQLSEAFLADCIEKGELPVAYYFKAEDLEPSVCRDTPEERIAAQDRLENIIFELEDEAVLDTTPIDLWCSEFEQSPAYRSLSTEEQESARSIIGTFADYAFNYCDEQAMDWKHQTVREVCLDILPRKFTADIESFEEIGAVLIQFFAFLDENKYLKNAGRLKQEMQKIKIEMVQRAKDPQNWGMAKSFAMDALSSGIDLSDTAAMNSYMAQYNAKLRSNLKLPNFGPKKPQLLRPARENPFKNIARNQMVRVKYPDGSIKDAKFKRVEEALLSGACELLS